MEERELDEEIRQTEDRLRRLLAHSAHDDSWACQVELRELVDRLRQLRARKEGERFEVPY